MKTKLLLLFLFFSIFNLYPSSTDKKFYNINVMHGVSLREMASVCKDKDGFIWASSKTGVIRVSDRNYKIYHLPFKSSNIINVRLSCENGMLIAFTNNGQIFRYNKLYDRFDFFMDLRKELDDHFISIDYIIIDKDGSFWMNTSAGFCHYDKKRLKRMNRNKLSVKCIRRFDSENIFVAQQENIYLMNTSTFKLKELFKYGRKLNVSSIFFDKKKRVIWLGTSTDGLFYYDMATKKLKSVEEFPKQPVTVITESPDATLLIGVDGKGMLEMNKESKSILKIFREDVDNPYSLRGNGVYDIFCDNNRRVWVVTYSGGLSYLEWNSTLINHISHQINNSNSLGNNDVNNIIEDSKGDIWFATNNGIYRWRVATDRWDSYYKNKENQAQVFQTLCEDDENRIWAGTYSSGFYVLDRESGRELAQYPNSQTPNLASCKFVMNLYKDSDGDIWIGGVTNLISYSKSKKEFRVYSQQPMRSFMEFAPGKILLGCTYSLILLDKASGHITYLAECLAQDIIVRGDDIWVATAGDGLLHYNYKTKKANRITMEAGLPSNFVNSLTYDNGYIWLGTENGLCKYNPNDNSVKSFYNNMAFVGTSFNNTAVCKLRNGELIWGTNNGAIMFNPNKLGKSLIKGKIFYENITIAGNSIRENKKLLNGIPVNEQTDLSFKSDQNTISLDLLALGVSSGEVKFSWKMDGLDTKYSNPSNQHIITYTNIPNGSYKLMIKMYNNSLSQVISERELNITVIPLFWQTWWFRLISIIIFAGIAIFLFRLYIIRLKQIHNEDKIRFFTNTAHDLRTSITLINAPIQELNKEEGLSGKGHYYLTLAVEQAERLSNVATQLLDFQKVDAGKGQLFPVMVDIVSLIFRRKTMFYSTAMKKNITINFSSNREEYFTAVDKLKIEKVIDNLLSNAIKYSFDDSTIDINIECTDYSWKMEVTDNGLGISENAQKRLFKEFYRGDNSINSHMVGSGIGLLLVKNYVIMHEGTVSLRSKENEGSKFTITIPYKEVSEKEVANSTDFSDVFSEKIFTKSAEPIKQDAGLKRTKSILIVDDNYDLRQFLKYSLEDEYRILDAENGLTAWELIKSESPDIIVSDVMMPEMDGFELCKLIKSTFETSHIPVILLTSLCERSNQLEGLGLGAEDYVTKPFDVLLLKQRIETIIRNRDIVRSKAIELVKSDADEEEKILPNQLNDNFVKMAVDVIKENINNIDFDKDSFAKEMNVSPSLLYKKLKSLTGQSPTDFIKDIRMKHAMDLLKSNRYSITEVSEMCGYSSISYFSTVFKKNYGKSPTEVLPTE